MYILGQPKYSLNVDFAPSIMWLITSEVHMSFDPGLTIFHSILQHFLSPVFFSFPEFSREYVTHEGRCNLSEIPYAQGSLTRAGFYTQKLLAVQSCDSLFLHVLLS